MIWFKVYHGTSADSKLALAARRGGVPLAAALGVWIYLLEMASASSPRGRVSMDFEEMSIPLGLEENVIEAIISVFVQKGMLSPDGTLPNFGKRQDYSGDRVRAFRQRQKDAQGSEDQAGDAVQAALPLAPEREVPVIPGFESTWEALSSSHPKKAGLQAALPILRGLAESAVHPEKTLQSITASHKRWVEYWSTEEGAQFVTPLDGWLKRDKYMDAPPKLGGGPRKGGRDWNKL